MNRPTSKPIKWKLKIEHLMACNCNWGCPCSFNAPPTHGTCEAALAYRVVEGRYGDAVLDGLAWVVAAAWLRPVTTWMQSCSASRPSSVRLGQAVSQEAS